jgi:hypothetical protein
MRGVSARRRGVVAAFLLSIILTTFAAVGAEICTPAPPNTIMLLVETFVRIGIPPF